MARNNQIELELERINVSQIRANARNARTHSQNQIQQIVASIEAFGFTNPILVDEKNVLIAGHGRLEAAKVLALLEVPAMRIPHLNDNEKRALMLADNKIALNAGWNEDILAQELADLSVDPDLDIDLTGFEVGEIDFMLDVIAGEQEDISETLPLQDPSLQPVSKRGDIWMLGQHRIMCGDALSTRDLDQLMDGQQADMGFIDPPYNVPIQGHVMGNGKVKHREFLQASGELSKTAFTQFLTDAFANAARVSKESSVWFACMDWRHIEEITAAGNISFDELINLCVWAKTNGGMGSLYRSQHELVFVFRKGARHRNNVQLGRFGRNRTNVWTYPGVNTFREGRMEELKAHPTAKPVAMVKDALMDVSDRGEIVLDTFLGGGATLMAAEASGRVAYGMELDPIYVDGCLRRWSKETGKDPIRFSDSKMFSELEAELSSEVNA